MNPDAFDTSRPRHKTRGRKFGDERVRGADNSKDEDVLAQGIEGCGTDDPER